MKAQILKIAGVNSEKEFYKKYPTEEAFFEAHPEAQMMMRNGGEMIKRADGSYSKRGLWDNIRANRGSGKKPTSEMLEQERKIKAKMQFGGMGMIQDKQNDLLGMADGLQKKYGPMLMQLAPMLLQEGGELSEMQKRQMSAQQAVQAADVLTNMFMKKGGSTYSGNVWFQDGGDPDEGMKKALLRGADKVAAYGLKGAKWIGKNVFGSDDIVPDGIKDYIYNTIRPVSYPTDLGQVAAEFMRSDKAKPTLDKEGDPRMDEEAWSRVLRRPTKSKYFVPSKHRPSAETDPEAEFYQMAPGVVDEELMKRVLNNNYFARNGRKNKKGEEYVPMETLQPFIKKEFMKGYKRNPSENFEESDPLANFQVYRKKDPKTGKPYLSISDEYNFGLESANELIKPMNIYHRVYGKGGTFSGNQYFQGGGMPLITVPNKFMTQLGDQEMIKQANQDMNQTAVMDPQVQQGAAADNVFAKQLQNGVANSNPAFSNGPQQSPFNQKLGAVQNKLAEGMVGDPTIGAIGSIIEGINNKKDYNAALDKQKRNYSTDYAYNTSYTTAASKGQYDMYGTMMPNQIGGNLSFTGMNQKYNMPKNMFEQGGAYETSATSWIPKEIGVPRDEAPYFVAAPKANNFDMVPSKTAAPAVENITRMNFNLSGNFEDYAGKAQRYLDKVAPGTDVKGADLAAAAQQAYQKHGKIVPVELALAQLRQEGYLAQGLKPNKPQRTKNPFNVGNTDSGATVAHSSVYSGIQSYYNLMASSYLKNKSPEQLLQNFTNSKGNRYASDKRYEDSIKQIIGKMKLKEGGEYELTEDQIQNIMRMGGQIEYC